MEKRESIKIHTEKHILTINYAAWDLDINIDELCRIQYDNIFGEMVTAPALLNKVGLLKADVEAETKEERLDLKMFEANRYSFHSKQLIGQGQKPIGTTVTSMVDEDPQILAKRKKLIQKEKELAYVEAMYWAVRDKSEKLNHILRPVTPEEFADQIIEGTINTLIIKRYIKS